MVEGKEGEGVMRQTDRMRVLIGIRTKCGTSNNEGNWKGGMVRADQTGPGGGGGSGAMGRPMGRPRMCYKKDKNHLTRLRGVQSNDLSWLIALQHRFMVV